LRRALAHTGRHRLSIITLVLLLLILMIADRTKRRRGGPT
jgi:hypothetical protein